MYIAACTLHILVVNGSPPELDASIWPQGVQWYQRCSDIVSIQLALIIECFVGKSQEQACYCC